MNDKHLALKTAAIAEMRKVIAAGAPTNENAALVIAGIVSSAFPQVEINWDFIEEMAEFCRKGDVTI